MKMNEDSVSEARMAEIYISAWFIPQKEMGPDIQNKILLINNLF